MRLLDCPRRNLRIPLLALWLITVVGCTGEEGAGASTARVGTYVCGTDDNGTSLDGGAGTLLASTRLLLDYQRAAEGTTERIAAALSAIRLEFELPAGEVWPAELAAQFAPALQESIGIRIEPARCAANEDPTVDASAVCPAPESCQEQGVHNEVACYGRCLEEVDLEVGCGLDGRVEQHLVCEVETVGYCAGECDGTCIQESDEAVACHGTCEGVGEGACSGSCDSCLDSGACAGVCEGTCDGVCSGQCSQTGAQALDCQGTCVGRCLYVDGSRWCESTVDGAVKRFCQGTAEIAVRCGGECTGATEPLPATCESENGCDLQVQFEARVTALCTPPRLVLDYVLQDDLTEGERLVWETRLVQLRRRLSVLRLAEKEAESVLAWGAALVPEDQAAGDFGTQVAGEDSCLVLSKALVEGANRPLLDLLGQAERLYRALTM